MAREDSTLLNVVVKIIICLLLLFTPVSTTGVVVSELLDACFMQCSKGLDSLKCFILVMLQCLYAFHNLMVVAIAILFNG
jgi:hypothetical protein